MAEVQNCDIDLDDQQMLLDIDCARMIRKVRELDERIRLLELRLTVFEEGARRHGDRQTKKSEA